MMAGACVVFAGIKGQTIVDSYVTKQSGTSLLLKENVEALSQDNLESKKYRAYKCYFSEVQTGTDGLICPEGTNPPEFASCPGETKKINIFSPSSSCIKEL